MIKNRAIAVALCLGLCGCSHTQQVVNITSIPVIQADLKHQVGIYIAAIADHEKQYQLHGDATPYWCGDGSLDFMITSVKLDITTTTDISNSANLSVSLPTTVPQPSVSDSTDLTNTQELSFTEYPWNPAAQDPDVLSISHSPTDIAGAPIAAALMNLRNDLLFATKKSDPKAVQACFSDVPTSTLMVGADPAKAGTAGDGDSFKIGLSFTNQVGGGLKISLGVISLGDTLTDKDVASNAITVSFKAVHWTKTVAQAALIKFAALQTVATDATPLRPAPPPAVTPTVPPECKTDDPPPSCFPDGHSHSLMIPSPSRIERNGNDKKQK